MLGALAVSPVRRNIVLLCLLSSGLSIAGLYIRELVRAPVRPQLLVLSGTYDAPWDINPWAGENLRQLERLQGRSVSIHRVNDLRTLAASSDAIVAALSEGKRSLRDAPLIVYVNLHGAVDEHGEPSLIPPGASADDSRTWISVRSLLQSLRSSAGSEHGILVAFESGRLAGAIRQLVQADRFAEGLQSLLAEEQFTGTSISAICAGGADRPSNNDWTGIGDPFTRILADALSGKADGFSPSNIQSTQSTILRDGFVDSHELSKYVVHELQHWNQRVYGCQVAISCFNTSPANTSTSLAGFAPNQIVAAPAEAVEGTEQRDSKVDALAETQSSQAPELDSFSDTSNCPNAFIAQAAPFRLTWCLSSIRPVEGVDPLPAPSAKAQIRSFWKELRDCSLEQPWTYFPGHWAQLQAEAVAYETSVYGGEAVRSEPRYAKNFQQHLKWLRRQLTDAKQLSVLKSRSGDAAKSWQQFSSSPTPEKARALSASWEGKLTAIPVLEILSRDTNNTTWEHSEELHRLAAKLQEVHLALTLASSLDGTKLKREALEEVNATSLAAFDHVLRGGHRVELNKLIDAFSLAADKFLALSSSVVASDRVIHIALEDAPAIASSLLLPSEVPCKLADHSLDQLSRLVESLREHLVAFSSPEKAIFGDRNETPRIRGAIEKLAETQHDMLHEYGRKNTSISLATQLLYLDRLLRFPTAVALASDGDAANIATLRLNARQRMIRNSQKLSMPVLRKEESTPIPASNSEAPTSITAAEPTGTAWGRSRTRKFWSDWGSLGRDASMQKPQSQPEVWQYAREDSRVIQGVETETRDDASSIPFAFGQLQSHAIRSRVVAGVLAEARGAWFVTRLRLSGEAADNLYAAGRAVDAFWAVPKIG